MKTEVEILDNSVEEKKSNYDWLIYALIGLVILLIISVLTKDNEEVKDIESEIYEDNEGS